MKKLKTVVIILFILFSAKSNCQLNFKMIQLETGKTMLFSDIFKMKSKIDSTKPTILITWSGRWCAPCIDLIEEYDKCASKKYFNLITVNVDNMKVLKDVMNDEFHSGWKNSVNFIANMKDSGSYSFRKVFSVNSAPLLIYFQPNRAISKFKVNYNYHPYEFVKEGIFPIEMVWDSPSDLNHLAWWYHNSKDEKADLKQAVNWIQRSISLNENYENCNTYAALLFKLEKYDDALVQAQKSIKIATKHNIDSKSSKKLIEKIKKLKNKKDTTKDVSE